MRTCLLFGFAIAARHTNRFSETNVERMSDTADHTVSATEARDKLSEILSHTQYAGDRTVLTRHGKPVAALVSMRDLEALQALEDATDVKRARESIEDARKHGGTKSLEDFRDELEATRTE